jgi:hypothetical protein
MLNQRLRPRLALMLSTKLGCSRPCFFAARFAFAFSDVVIRSCLLRGFAFSQIGFDFV